MRPSSSAAREPVPLRLPPARLRPLGAAVGGAQDRRAHVRAAQEAAEQVSVFTQKYPKRFALQGYSGFVAKRRYPVYLV